jgi:acyl carrier protein
MMTKEAIFKQIQKLLVETFELEEHTVSLEAHIYNDLDLDSFDAIDLAVQVGKETGIKFQEDELRSIRTVADIVDVLYHKLNA